jgi:hypothetical protein
MFFYNNNQNHKKIKNKKIPKLPGLKELGLIGLGLNRYVESSKKLQEKKQEIQKYNHTSYNYNNISVLEKQIEFLKKQIEFLKKQTISFQEQFFYKTLIYNLYNRQCYLIQLLAHLVTNPIKPNNNNVINYPYQLLPIKLPKSDRTNPKPKPFK